MSSLRSGSWRGKWARTGFHGLWLRGGLRNYSVSNFRVFFNRKAERGLYGLPKGVLSSVYDLVSDLEVDPVPWRRWDVKPLKGQSGLYRVRLAQYRVIYSVYLDRER